jgi:ABC-type uncharacterized transport system permease subunit
MDTNKILMIIGIVIMAIFFVITPIISVIVKTIRNHKETFEDCDCSSCKTLNCKCPSCKDKFNK